MRPDPTPRRRSNESELERRARIRLALGRGTGKSLARLGVPEGVSVKQAQSYYKDVGTGAGVTPPGIGPDPAPSALKQRIKKELTSPDSYRAPKKPKKRKNIPGTVTPGHYTL